MTSEIGSVGIEPTTDGFKGHDLPSSDPALVFHEDKLEASGM